MARAILDSLVAPYYKVKFFLQRGFRGYSDSDLWGLDTYLAGVLAKSLLSLNEKRMGHPCFWDDKEEGREWAPEECNVCKCEEIWDRELKENAERFRLLEADDWYQQGDDWLKKGEENDRLALEWLARNFRALWW